MNRRPLASILILLAATSLPAGCAGTSRSYIERQQAAIASRERQSQELSSENKAPVNEHADLERELNLYSD